MDAHPFRAGQSGRNGRRRSLVRRERTCWRGESHTGPPTLAEAARSTAPRELEREGSLSAVWGRRMADRSNARARQVSAPLGGRTDLSCASATRPLSRALAQWPEGGTLLKKIRRKGEARASSGSPRLLKLRVPQRHEHWNAKVHRALRWEGKRRHSNWRARQVFAPLSGRTDLSCASVRWISSQALAQWQEEGR